MAAAEKAAEAAAPPAPERPKGSGQEKNQKPPEAKGNGSPGGASDIKKILEQIDTELNHLKEGAKLKELIGKLKTQLIGELLTKVTHGQKPTYAAALQTAVPQTKPATPRELREIQVKRTNLTNEEAAKPTEEIVRELNNKFKCLGVGRILGARQLQSGDLVLLADSSDTKKRAEAKKGEWVGILSTGAEIRPKKHTVLVHGVQVNGFDNQRQAEGIQKIYEQNPAIRGGVRVARFRWRKRALRLKKTASSLMLDVANPEGANALIEEGLVLDGELKEVERFDPQCLVTRCYNCQKYGHNAKNCRHPQMCGHCAAPGHTHETCPFRGDKTKQRCANCSGRHRAGSLECGKHMEEMSRAQRARETKPRLFEVPAGGVPPPPEDLLGAFETTATTGKRLAETQLHPGAAAESQRGEKPRADAGWETPARRQRGRPRQTLATPNDNRLSSFFPRILSQGVQGTMSQTSLVLATQSAHDTDTEPEETERPDQEMTEAQYEKWM
jgi:hypothetical protein